MVQRVVCGKDRRLGGDRFLHVPTIGMGHGEGAIGGMDRKDPVAVDQLDAAAPFADDALIERGMEEAWKIIRYDGTCLFRERLRQGMTIAATRFDIGEVTCAGRSDLPGVIPHTVDDKPVESIACPWIADAERFQDEEGALKLDGPFDGSLQGEIGVQSPKRRHPVKDVFPMRLDRFAGRGSDSDFRNGRGHGRHHGSSDRICPV